MSWILGNRRATILACGLVAATASLLAPHPARSDSSDCLEPYLERCLLSTAGCVNCNNWCKVVVGQNCVEEYAYCQTDPESCEGYGEGYVVYEECSCKVGSPDPEA